jgi:hypothetical protein
MIGFTQRRKEKEGAMVLRAPQAFLNVSDRETSKRLRRISDAFAPLFFFAPLREPLSPFHVGGRA